MSCAYSSIARDAVHEFNKSKDKLIIYKFMNKIIKYAEESPHEFIIPIVSLSEETLEELKPKSKRVHDKANIGLRFTENCIISNRCSSKCYRYKICRDEYIKRLHEDDTEI